MEGKKREKLDVFYRKSKKWEDPCSTFRVLQEIEIKTKERIRRLNRDKDLPIELKTIHNKQLTVHNVPHIKREYPGPNGDMFYLQSNVMYALSHIFQEMINNGDKEYDYSEFQF